MKRTSKKDPEAEDRIGVAAIAKVERTRPAQRVGEAEAAEGRGTIFPSTSRPSLSDFPQQGDEFKRHCAVTRGHSRSLSTGRPVRTFFPLCNRRTSLTSPLRRSFAAPAHSYSLQVELIARKSRFFLAPRRQPDNSCQELLSRSFDYTFSD